MSNLLFNHRFCPKQVPFEIILLLLLPLSNLWSQAKTDYYTISAPAQTGRFDCWELSARILPKKAKAIAALNPFTDIDMVAVITNSKGAVDTVRGFSDASDGSRLCLRYMPRSTGTYACELLIKGPGWQQMHRTALQVNNSTQLGPLRVDQANPWHFVHEGSERHFFWNSTTTYWMLGWKDEAIIQQALDRLADYQINRIRVAINARQDDGKRWAEPLVKESEKFTFLLNPWVAARPTDLDNPGFDVTRFNVAHWQKLDRLVQYARERNIIVSLIFYVDGLDHGCDPFKKANMGNADEQRYYRYAAARYSGYTNIMWDVTNEYHLFRNEAWVDKMGTLLRQSDPAKHLISVHGHAEFPFRKSPWVDLVLYQSWDECGGYEFMTECRQRQQAAGRILPQVNEEYGYEDTYPTWGCGATASKKRDGRNADNRRRLAWEICMAGGYQTTGERANEGTGAGNDSGGGWINGRGNASMTMLNSYRIMKEVFEATPLWWTMQPANQLTNLGNLCLANPENGTYLLYTRLQHARLVLPQGEQYEVIMINPRTGEQQQLGAEKIENYAWQYPYHLSDDWVFRLQRK
jgi:Protein of unknown function (DUF4038)